MADNDSAVNSANSIVLALIERFARELEDVVGGDVISYCGPLIAGADEYIRAALEGRPRKRRRLVVVLETEGGALEPVARIVDTLRHHYPSRVEFIIPNFAYSAGTVLALSANEIHMDYFSVLGPIDPQVEDQDGRFIPAWGYVERYEELIEKSERGDITNAEMMILLQSFDQGTLQWYKHSRELAVTLVRDWVARYKFAGWRQTRTSKQPVTPEMRKRRAEEIAEKLSDISLWHAHGRGISREVLVRDVGLQIRDLRSRPKLNAALRVFDNLLHDFATKMGYQTFVYTPGQLVVPFRYQERSR